VTDTDLLSWLAKLDGLQLSLLERLEDPWECGYCVLPGTRRAVMVGVMEE
jgi:hypothetical protein